MKKIMALLLVLCMMLTFGACKKNEEEIVMKTEIVGEWMAVSVNAAAVFNEDGTGVLEYNGKQDVTWKYDPEADNYIVTGDETYTVTAGKEYDMPYISINDIDFYQMDDYDKAYTLLLSRRLESTVYLTEGMTKIKLDTRYSLTENVLIEFTDISREMDGEILAVSYEITNHRSEVLNEPICAEVFGSCYIADHPTAWSLYRNIEFEYPIEPNETVSGVVTLCELTDVAQPTIDKFDMVIGAVYFQMYGQQYYVELGEFFH